MKNSNDTSWDRTSCRCTVFGHIRVNILSHCPLCKRKLLLCGSAPDNDLLAVSPHALPWHVSVTISRFWLYDGLPACPDRRNVAKKSSGEMLYPRIFSQIWPHQNSLILVFQCRLMSAQFAPVCLVQGACAALCWSYISRRALRVDYVKLCWKPSFYCLILVSGSSLSQLTSF
jgi:hypothetical protein